MRTTDPDPQPFRPLGEKVTPPPPEKPQWTPVEGVKGIEQGKDGKWRTALPVKP